jgi:hypothetical protein
MNAGKTMPSSDMELASSFRYLLLAIIFIHHITCHKQNSTLWVLPPRSKFLLCEVCTGQEDQKTITEDIRKRTVFSFLMKVLSFQIYSCTGILYCHTYFIWCMRNFLITHQKISGLAARYSRYSSSVAW